MNIPRTTAISIAICTLSSPVWGQGVGPSCDCHLVDCDENGDVVASFWTTTPVQAVVKEGDSVENEVIFDRDMDVRPAMWIRVEEFEAVEDAIGIQADMDNNGDGWLLMEFNFSLFNRRQFNEGACEGFSTPVHQQAMIIVGSEGRQNDGTWPFYIPVGWSDAPVELSSTIHFQPNSTILSQLTHDGDGDVRETAFTGDVTSADKNTKVRFRFDYAGDIAFADATFNLRDGNFPLPVTDGTYQYCFPTRTRATIPADDPNLWMSFQTAGGQICLPLQDSQGDPICLNPRKGSQGQIELARLRIIRYGGIECQSVLMPD